MKGIAVLGSTGSIGRQTLDVVRAFPDEFRVVGLGGGSNLELLSAQVREFQPLFVSWAEGVQGPGPFTTGRLVTMEEMAQAPEVELLVVATTGKAGLIPTLLALERGKAVALANKEVIIMAGELVTRYARSYGGTILPVDSEASAIWQCLRGEDQGISRVILTASGGPFRRVPLDDLKAVTPEEALRHPTWQMGRKITIDSATLVNKAFEVIEVHWLFDIPWQKIEVIIHPQSIIHSMVEFVDGSVKAQLSPPDMRFPIQCALLYPRRLPNDSLTRFDPLAIGALTFEPLEPERYPCFAIALEAGKRGGTFPAVLNAADEVAVELFLEGRIGFTDIPELMERVVSEHRPSGEATLEAILAADEWARERARALARV